MSKISGYANSVSALGTDDLLDVSEKISSSPDVYESRKMTGATLATFIQNYTNDSIYSASGTVPSSVVAAITDFLRFSGGRLDLSTTTDGFLMPRLTTAQMNAIASPTTNLLIYNTDLSGLYRYNGSAWVALSAGYGIIEIIRDSDAGIPTFYADLQTALETCKSGTNTLKLHSNVTITSTVSIKSNGSGLGFGYSYDSLTIDLNGYIITNSNADNTYCFDILVSNNSAIDRVLTFKNGTVNRTNATGTNYCLYATPSSNYGTLLMSNMTWYNESGYGAYIGIQKATTSDYDYCDLGGSIFISDTSYGLYNRSFNCKNYSVVGNSSTDAYYQWNSDNINFSVLNTSTGKGITLRGNTNCSNFTIESNTGVGIYAADDFSGIASNFNVTTTTGDGIETTGTNSSYKPKFLNFSVTCDNGVCIDSNHTNTIFENFLLTNNGTAKTISFVNNNTIEISNGTVLNYGSGQALEIYNTSLLNITNVKFISTSECVGVIHLDNASFNCNLELCKFLCNYNDATGNCIEITNSTGNIKIDICKFEVVNSSANGLYASATRSVELANSVFRGATTPINANITVNASTDLGNGNRQY